VVGRSSRSRSLRKAPPAGAEGADVGLLRTVPLYVNPGPQLGDLLLDRAVIASRPQQAPFLICVGVLRVRQGAAALGGGRRNSGIEPDATRGRPAARRWSCGLAGSAAGAAPRGCRWTTWQDAVARCRCVVTEALAERVGW
jgi:hypothetical protein